MEAVVQVQVISFSVILDPVVWDDPSMELIISHPQYHAETIKNVQ